MSSCCQTAASCCDKPSATQKASVKVALVGNPNCGKTTLFNALTGARQRVGNWPGVTVERKSGYFTKANTTVEVIDLPGIYSLTSTTETMAVDERIACDFIFHQNADVIVNIVDASNLERHLYLSTQLLEMGVPFILALNMMDVARARQINIDIKRLSLELGCPVVALEANKGDGVEILKQQLISYDASCQVQKDIPYPAAIQKAVNVLALQLDTELTKHNLYHSKFMAVRLLEDDAYVRGLVSAHVLQAVSTQQKMIQQTLSEDADILLADARYQFVQTILKHTSSVNLQTKKKLVLAS